MLFTCICGDIYVAGDNTDLGYFNKTLFVIMKSSIHLVQIYW